MSPEERQILQSLFDRVRQASSQPRDAEAEALIAGEVRAQPYAPYLLSQTVIVQEQALTAAAARIEELEARVRDLETREAEAPAAGGFLGGIGKSLFGDSSRGRFSVPAAGGGAVWTQRGQRVDVPSPAFGAGQQPGPGLPQGPQGGPWAQRGGGGFLQGALGAAAGVAGGVLLANTIGGLMGGGAKDANAANPAAAPAPAASDTAAAGQDAAFQPASYDEGALDSGLGDWDTGFDDI